MKKALLFVSMLTFGLSYAQDCSKIFISEYVEGWSNNKALEIYNPTSSPVDLSQYVVARYSNGSNTATVQNAVQLSGTIQPYDVFVVVLDQRNPNGTGNNAPIWDSLEVRGDGFFCPVYEENDAMYFNGDDAMVLFQGVLGNAPLTTDLNTLQLVAIDIIGKIGQRPTNAGGGTSQPTGGWSTTYPHAGGPNGGVAITADHSMIRKAGIKAGVTNFVIPFFNPLEQWDSIPPVTYVVNDAGDTLKSVNGNPILFGNWFSLGTHDCECNPLSVKENNKVNVEVYPNPTTNGTFTIASDEMIESVVIYNGLGQMVKKITVNATTKNISIGDIPGLYVVQISSNSGVVTKRLIVK